MDWMSWTSFLGGVHCGRNISSLTVVIVQLALTQTVKFAASEILRCSLASYRLLLFLVWSRFLLFHWVARLIKLRLRRDVMELIDCSKPRPRVSRDSLLGSARLSCCRHGSNHLVVSSRARTRLLLHILLLIFSRWYFHVNWFCPIWVLQTLSLTIPVAIFSFSCVCLTILLFKSCLVDELRRKN